MYFLVPQAFWPLSLFCVWIMSLHFHPCRNADNTAISVSGQGVTRTRTVKFISGSRLIRDKRAVHVRRSSKWTIILAFGESLWNLSVFVVWRYELILYFRNFTTGLGLNASSSPASANPGSGYDEHKPKTPPPDLPSLLLDSRIVYIGMPVLMFIPH